MPENSNPKGEQGYYFVLAQIGLQTGLEMVAPIFVGVYIDRHFGWTPWSTSVGAVLGLVGGMTHMLMTINRHDKSTGSRDPS